MYFKKMRGVRVPEEVQGYIRFTCLCYDRQTAGTKLKIDKLIEEVGGDNREALREVMCSKHGIRYIAQTFYISEMSLYRLRKKFYEAWE